MKKILASYFLMIIALSLILAVNNLAYPKQILAKNTNLPQAVASLQNIQNTTQTTPRIPILIYHYVEIVRDKKDATRKSLDIQPQVLEAQIVTLQKAGYTFITPGDIVQIKSGQIKNKRPIILSFDDGYRDFYTDVFPILKKYRVKSIAYIVPGFLGHPNYMFWSQIKELDTSGLVELGAHTMHHTMLDTQTPQIAEQEIFQSKLAIQLYLGHDIRSFAYPYGHFNATVENLVKSAGFTTAVTTMSGSNTVSEDMLILRRIHPGASTGVALLSKIE